MPDIILFRDCTVLSLYHSLIVVLDRTVPDFFIASPRCRTSNIRVAERCATGDGCPHLTTEHGHSVFRGDSIHGDKDRHLSCACAALRLELMPDIILFRDCAAISFTFFSLTAIVLFPPQIFHCDAVQQSTAFWISMLSCGFPEYRGGHFHLMRT